MGEKSEQEILANVRTLLAIERNYLAEKRTALAEFRTGLTLMLTAPPAISLITYFFQSIPIIRNPIFDSVIYLFLAIITILGVRISVNSRSKLRKISQKIKLLQDRENKMIKQSKIVYDLLCDCLSQKEE